MSIRFLLRAIVYINEYLARCALVLRFSVSIDSNAANALSGLVHITASAVSMIRLASLLTQEETNTMMATTAIVLMTISNDLMSQITAT